ncbi:hypothetical protein DFQ27_001314 [Actinomortierella ambigua]|uniref:Uncharacterized protein n=1 Tax=Actinomortierella ambigua TaxID=1343610 RepID=A0A9P6PM16_9FUNG|nr:hypothetical protein DFQ27_001314 [Actinomortierella ambigua]
MRLLPNTITSIRSTLQSRLYQCTHRTAKYSALIGCYGQTDRVSKSLAQPPVVLFPGPQEVIH